MFRFKRQLRTFFRGYHQEVAPVVVTILFLIMCIRDKGMGAPATIRFQFRIDVFHLPDGRGDRGRNSDGNHARCKGHA